MQQYFRALYATTRSVAIWLVLLVTMFAGSRAQAVEPLSVGVLVSPPFVMTDGETYTGLAIDLWESIAPGIDRSFVYKEYKTFGELLKATSERRVDMAIANLTINQQRAQRVDFTQPWFDGGMRVMVSTENGSGFRGVLKGLYNAGFIKAYAWLALIVIVASILFTLFDRRFDASFPKRWRDGMAESFYTVMSIVTSGRPPVRKNLFGWLGRVWQALWLLCGIAVLAFVTSSVTSVMTTLSLTHQINSVDDLTDQSVGVLSGTVEEDYARARGLAVHVYSGLDEASEALAADEIRAIIADAPVLEYYVYTNPGMPVKVVGRLFERDKYGFALARQSPLTRDMTLAVLGAVDAGEVESLRVKYFGGEH